MPHHPEFVNDRRVLLRLSAKVLVLIRDHCIKQPLKFERARTRLPHQSLQLFHQQRARRARALQPYRGAEKLDSEFDKIKAIFVSTAFAPGVRTV